MQNWSSVNVPNALSFLRLLLAIPLVYAVLESLSLLALGALALAAATDWADGFIARRFQMQTQLGAWLDPLADKVILNATFLALASQELIPYWVALLLLSRDVVITTGAYLYFRAQKKMDGEANFFGKVSTLLQFGVVGWCVLFPELQVDESILIGMVLVTLSSGAVYVALWGRVTLSRTSTPVDQSFDSFVNAGLCDQRVSNLNAPKRSLEKINEEAL